MALTDNLIAYWKMDDNAANATVTDEVGNNTGTFQDPGDNPNTDNHTVAGKIGTALDFDGADDYIDCGDHSSTNFINATTDFSISFWYKMDAVGNTYERYFTRQDGATGDGWCIARNGASGPSFIIEISGDQDYLGFHDGDDFPATWTFYVVAYDWSEDKLDVYKDNVLIRDAVSVSSAGAFGWASDDSLHMMARGGDAATFAEGDLDEVGLWNRIITVAEVSDLWNNGDGLTHPFGAAGAMGIPLATANLNARRRILGSGSNTGLPIL